MSTIKDVAKYADVSIATVSRVINNNYPVSEDIKTKVLKAIEKLKYQPNAVARSLKNNRTFLVGMVVPDISNPYFMDMARGVESVVYKEGYNLIFGSTDEDAQKEIKLIHAFNERRVDYLVLATRNTDSSMINPFIEQGLNIVLIDSKLKNIKADSITENDYDSAYKLVSYLINKGHKKIAIVQGEMTVSTSNERYNGYKQALQDNNIDLNKQYLIKGDYNKIKAYQSFSKLLVRYKDNKEFLPTAVFSCNNIMTEGILRAIKENRMVVPDDISLVSFGDITVPELIDPVLTIVEQHSYEMGKTIGKYILDKINCKVMMDNYKNITIDLKIREGNSVKDQNN